MMMRYIDNAGDYCWIFAWRESLYSGARAVSVKDSKIVSLSFSLYLELSFCFCVGIWKSMSKYKSYLLFVFVYTCVWARACVKMVVSEDQKQDRVSSVVLLSPPSPALTPLLLVIVAEGCWLIPHQPTSAGRDLIRNTGILPRAGSGVCTWETRAEQTLYVLHTHGSTCLAGTSTTTCLLLFRLGLKSHLKRAHAP